MTKQKLVWCLLIAGTVVSGMTNVVWGVEGGQQINDSATQLYQETAVASPQGRHLLWEGESNQVPKAGKRPICFLAKKVTYEVRVNKHTLHSSPKAKVSLVLIGNRFQTRPTELALVRVGNKDCYRYVACDVGKPIVAGCLLQTNPYSTGGWWASMNMDIFFKGNIYFYSAANPVMRRNDPYGVSSNQRICFKLKKVKPVLTYSGTPGITKTDRSTLLYLTVFQLVILSFTAVVLH